MTPAPQFQMSGLKGAAAAEATQAACFLGPVRTLSVDLGAGSWHCAWLQST